MARDCRDAGTARTAAQSSNRHLSSADDASVEKRIPGNGHAEAQRTMVKNFGAKSCGKDAKRKSQKPTFPLCLEIPQTPRDSPFPTASAAAVYVTNSFRTKGDISILVSTGTFLNWYDKLHIVN
jgi:hypothetical protein